MGMFTLSHTHTHTHTHNFLISVLTKNEWSICLRMVISSVLHVLVINVVLVKLLVKTLAIVFPWNVFLNKSPACPH